MNTQIKQDETGTNFWVSSGFIYVWLAVDQMYAIFFLF